MADSRHNKYVSVTDWFKPAPGSTTSGTVSGSTGAATSGASFVGGSWGSGGSGGGLTITIIKTNDTTPESNSNVYSALRVHNSFIAKDKDERTEGKLSSDAGFEVGEFVSGVSGAICYVDPETLQTTAELDRLKVRVKAYFETLEIVNVNSVGGKQIISPAGSINCIRVDEHGGTIDILKERQATDEEGNPLYDINGNPIMETYIESVDNGVPEDTYRCYFLAELDGETIENRFHVGDQAYSQMFDAQPGISSNVSSKYYWRLVTGISYDPIEIAGKKYHYIDLSVSDCDTDSDAPSVGDIICHRGHRTLPGDIEGRDRQNALEFSAVDTFSPSITLYQGIGESDPDNGKYPYSLVGKDIIQYGVNRLNNRAFMNVYGDMYVGDRDGQSYLQFDETAGLTVKGNIQFGSKSKMEGDDLTLEERIELASKAYEEDVNQFKAAVEKSFLDVLNQIDGAIETYFLDPEPTLENEPAIDWNTDLIKAAHVGDLYYSKQGNAYRFQYDEITDADGSKYNLYYWNLIKDTDITLALANAQKAQDTADSKRKIFVKQPSTNDSYEEGDMWANATYPATGTPRYSNDLLRAITAKQPGEAFSIDHWVLSSKYTDDTAAIAAQEAADEAQRAANNAQSDATAAANRLSSWAADNVISPTEKQGIKEEYVRVIKDKDSIHEQWDQYFLDTTGNTEIGKIYIAYNNAYLPYVEQLIYLFTAKDSDGVALENIPIPDNFDDNQTAYYSNRAIALNTIAAAAKKVADDAQAAADNAYEEAEKALTAAEEAKTSVYGLNTTVTGLKDFTDDAFLDGIINSSERKTIENYIYQINTVLAQVQQSYSEVVDNTFLVESVAKTNLENSYNAFITATNELLQTVNVISNQGSVENIDRAGFEVKYNNFNSKYSDYTKYLNAAIKFIEYAINSRVDTTLQELGGYSYLKNAFNEETTVTGGLVLTSLVALGYTDDNQQYHVMGGINGSHSNNDGIAIWAGGSAVDRAIEPNNPNAADFLVRMDGTGYAAGGNFSWDSSGKIFADPQSFLVTEDSIGALLTSFQVNFDQETGKPNFLIPLVPFTTITIASDLVLGDSARVSFGNVYLAYDSTNNSVYVANQDGSPVNFYTTGGISMFGQGNISVNSIMDAISLNLDPNTLTIQNGVLTVIGGTGSEGINEEQLEVYLTNNNYAKKSDIPSLSGYATQAWVSSQGYITGITSAMVTSALGFTPYNADNFTKAKIKSTLGISDWALAESKPSYTYTEIGGTPDLSVYALKTSLSSYQPLISTTNKLAYSLISGTPTSLKNPTSLTFGSKTYDGSEAKTINASDLGALTSHQTIYALTLQEGTFSAGTYTPNSAAKTINIPTTTAHISESGNLYFTNARAVSALSSTLANYVTLGGSQTITGAKNFTGGLSVNGGSLVYNASEGYWKLEGNLLVTGGVSMYNTGEDISGGGTGGGGSIDYPLSWSGFSSGSFDGSAAKTIYIPSKLSELTNDASYAKTSDLSGYLPLSGGTLTNLLTLQYSNPRIAFKASRDETFGSLGVFSGKFTWYTNRDNKYNDIIHSGNYSSYALPVNGGGEIYSDKRLLLTLKDTNTSSVERGAYMKFVSGNSSSNYAAVGINTTVGTFLENMYDSVLYSLNIKNDGTLRYSHNASIVGILSAKAANFGGDNGLNIGMTYSNSTTSAYDLIERKVSGGNLYFQYNHNGGVVMCTGGGYVGVGGNASYKFHAQGASESFSVPISVIDNTSTTSWIATQGFRAKNITKGQYVAIEIGKAFENKNCGHLSFYYDGDGSNDNRFALGFYNVVDVLSIRADRKVLINSTTDNGGVLQSTALSNEGAFLSGFSSTTYAGVRYEQKDGYYWFSGVDNTKDFYWISGTSKQMSLTDTGMLRIYHTSQIPLELYGTSTVEVAMKIYSGTTPKGIFGWHKDKGAYLYNISKTRYLGIKDDGTPHYSILNGDSYTLIHSGNIGSQSVSYASNAGTCSGNAASATKLQTARTIWGQSFDGSKNVSGVLTLGTNYITGNDNANILDSRGQWCILGAGTSEKEFPTYIDGFTITLRYGTAHTEGVRISSSGYVGVGTTSPSSKLHLYSTENTTLRIQSDGSGGDQGAICMKKASDNGLVFAVENRDFIWQVGTSSITGDGTERMRLTNSGNVGIGTAKPDAKLHIVGKLKFTDWDDDGTFLRVENPNKGKAFISIYATGGNAYTLGQDGLRFLINHSYYGNVFNILNGNIGIGTTNPAYKLDVNGTLNATTIYQNGTTLVNTYLSLSGGTLSANNRNLLLLKDTNTGSNRGAYIRFDAGTTTGYSLVGYNNSFGAFLETSSNEGYYSLRVNHNGYLSYNSNAQITYTPTSTKGYTGLEIINAPTGGEASIGFTSTTTKRAVVGVWSGALNLWTASKLICLSIPIDTGNVLINTSDDDSAKLQVVGAVNIKNSGYALYWGSSKQYRLGSNENSDFFIYDDNVNSTADFRIGTGGRDRIRVKANGNTLLNTTTDNGYKLSVNGSMELRAGDYINDRATLILNSNSSAPGDIIFKCNSTTKTNYGWWAISSRNDSTGSFAIFRGSENGANSSEARVLSLDPSGNMLLIGSITMNSMRSMKNIINENGLSLEELSTIKPTRFTWKDGRDDRIHVGGIADDVMKVLPEVVFKGSDGVLSMDYASAAFVMAASLIQPMTEHERRIANLERENALLKEEIRNLKSV